MEIGNALRSSSVTANVMESLISFGTLINDGAPKDSCKDLAPLILALSNLVSLGGPIKTLFSEVISLSSNSTSLYVTTSSSGRFDFLIVWSICNSAFMSRSSEICSVSKCFFIFLLEEGRFDLDSTFLAVFSLTGEDVFEICFPFEECFTTKEYCK